MPTPVAELSATDTIPILRAGVGDAYSGPPGRGAWSPEGAAWGDQLGGPGYTPLSHPSRGPHKPVGAFACSRVTPAASLAFLDESMVGCSWSTTGRTALFLRTRAGHRPWIGLPHTARFGLRPRGLLPGAACLRSPLVVAGLGDMSPSCWSVAGLGAAEGSVRYAPLGWLIRPP